MWETTLGKLVFSSFSVRIVATKKTFWSRLTLVCKQLFCSHTRNGGGVKIVIFCPFLLLSSWCQDFFGPPRRDTSININTEEEEENKKTSGKWRQVRRVFLLLSFLLCKMAKGNAELFYWSFLFLIANFAGVEKEGGAMRSEHSSQTGMTRHIFGLQLERWWMG